jgi:hypothetical protein
MTSCGDVVSIGMMKGREEREGREREANNIWMSDELRRIDI